MNSEDTIVAPDQMSVRELRQWLSQVGDKHRDHFERGRFPKVTNGQRMKQIEMELASSSSSTTTSTAGASPNDSDAAVSDRTMTGSNNVVELLALPVFRAPSSTSRQFGEEEQPSSPTGTATGHNQDHSGPNDYRIVSVRKLQGSPPSPPKLHAKIAESLLSWSEGDLDKMLSDWPQGTSLWSPNTFRPFVLDEEQTVQSVDKEVVAAPETAKEEFPKLDNVVPCDSSTVEIELNNFQRTDYHQAHISPSKKNVFRKKLPLLLCKCVKENDNDMVDQPQCISGHVDEQNRDDSQKVTSATTATLPDETKPTISSLPFSSSSSSSREYAEPHLLARNDAAIVSPWRDYESQLPLDATMGDIFEDEMRRVDRHAEEQQQQQSGAPKKTTFVKATMEQFGGCGKKGSVQRRREALERKWAEDRPLTHAKKVRWHVANGTYKKKVILNIHK